MPEHSFNHNHSLNKKTKNVCIILASSIILVGLTNIYAKYIKKIEVDAPIVDYMAEYQMEVISDDGTEVKLKEKLKLANINPGEFQVIPFIVRNAAKKDGNGYLISDVDMVYSIEIAHTENLPLKYELYEYLGSDNDGNPIYELLDDYTIIDTNGDNNYQNTSEKQVYYTNSVNNQFELEATTGVISQTKFRLVVTWDNTSNVQIDNKYVREVDLAYIVVNGAQKDVN